EVLESLFEFVKGQRTLTVGYIKEIHAALLRNQESYGAVDSSGKVFPKILEKGKYKTEPNSPTRPDGEIHEYAPPEHAASEMDRLVEMHSMHQDIPVEVAAAWLHH